MLISRRGLLLGGSSSAALLTMPLHIKGKNEKLISLYRNKIVGEAILDDNKISIKGIDGVVSHHNPIALMDICCYWFSYAKEKGWNYYDEVGNIVSHEQLNYFIRDLKRSLKNI